MAYRIVISLVEMKHILEVLDRRKIIESSDLIEQEDYLFIRKGDEVKLIVALNKMTSLYISNRSIGCLHQCVHSRMRNIGYNHRLYLHEQSQGRMAAKQLLSP